MAIEERSTERAAQRLGNRISLRNLVRMGEARADDQTTRLLNQEEREEQGRDGDTNVVDAQEARDIISSARANGDRLRFSEDRTRPGHYLVEIAGRRGAVEVDLSPEAASLFQDADDILVGRPQLRGLGATPLEPTQPRRDNPELPTAPENPDGRNPLGMTYPITVEPVYLRGPRDDLLPAGQTAHEPNYHRISDASGTVYYVDITSEMQSYPPRQMVYSMGDDGNLRPMGGYVYHNLVSPTPYPARGTTQGFSDIQLEDRQGGAPAAPGVSAEQPATGAPAVPATGADQPAPAFAAGDGAAARPYNRVTVPTGLHQNQVEAVQGLLVNAGLNVGGPGGAADGKWGRHSQAAFEQLCREAQPPIDPATVDFNNLQDPETLRFVQAAQARADQRAGRTPQAPEQGGPASDRWLQQYSEMSIEQLQQINTRYNARTTPAFNDITALETNARTTMGDAITADGVISPAERALLSQSANGRLMLAYSEIPPLPENPTREQLIERFSLIDRLGEAHAAGRLTDGPDVARIIAENRTAVTAALTPRAETLVAQPAAAQPDPALAAGAASRTIEDARTELVAELQGTIGRAEAGVIEGALATASQNGQPLTDRNGQVNSTELGAFQTAINGMTSIEGLDQLRDQLRAAGVRDGQTVAGGEVVVASTAPTLLQPGQGAGVAV